MSSLHLRLGFGLSKSAIGAWVERMTRSCPSVCALAAFICVEASLVCRTAGGEIVLKTWHRGYAASWRRN